TFDKVVWLNPVPDDQWGWSGSLNSVKSAMDDKMYPLTLNGLEKAMRELTR
ncbi:MAG: hypothetical protein ACJA0E_001105, partial [Bermanella sp.]